MSETTYPAKGAGHNQAASPSAPEGERPEGDDAPKSAPNPRDAMIERMADEADETRFVETAADAEEFGVMGPDGVPGEPAQIGVDGAASVEPVVPEPAPAGPTLPDHIVVDGDKAYLRTKIDGKETLVPLDAVRDTIQKHESADAQFRHNASVREDLARREQAVAEREQQFVQQPTPIAPLPTGVDDQALLEGAKDVIKNLYNGDEDDAAKKLVEVISSARVAEQATTPAVDPEELARNAAAIATKERREEDRVKDVKAGWNQFTTDYPDLVADDDYFAVVNRLSDVVIAEHPDWTPGQVMLEAGSRTRAKLNLPTPGQAAADPAPELENDRLDGKRNLVRQPQQRLEVQPTVDADDDNKPQTNAEIFADLKRSRGQPT